MLTLSSNIAEVIDDLDTAETLIERAGEKVVRDAGQYEPQMREWARQILSLLAESDDERAAIPALVASVTWAAHEYSMTALAGSVAPFGAGPVKQGASLNDAILDWVARYKDKTSERDAYKGGRGREPGEWQSNETIAARIAAILKNQPGTFGPDDPTGLLAYLAAAGVAGFAATNLSEARLSQLMAGVLDFWAEALGAKLASDLLNGVHHALES